MYGKIMLGVVWSLVIIRIKSQPLGVDHDEIESQLLGVDRDAVQLRKHLDKELRSLDTVVSYYKKMNKKSSSKIWERTDKPDKPDDAEAFALIQASFFTFWMAVTLRTYSVFRSCIYNKEISTELNLVFNEMTFALNKFKEAITEYRNGRYQNDEGNFTIEKAADEILGLNLDFVSSEDTLTKRTHGQYVNGIIKWNLIPAHKLHKKPYKTIFPSCLLIRKLFHDKISILGRNILHYPYVLHENAGEIFEKQKTRFAEVNSIEFYEQNWPNIMKDLKSLFTPNFSREGLFVIFIQIVQDVIDIPRVSRLQNFLIDSTLGEHSLFVKDALGDRIWILSPYLRDLENIWRDVKQKSYINEQSKCMFISQFRLHPNSIDPTEECIKDVIAIIQSIIEVELRTHPNIKRHL